jgi:hypothetical protein
MLNLDLTGTPASGEYATMYLVFELSDSAVAHRSALQHSNLPPYGFSSGIAL